MITLINGVQVPENAIQLRTTAPMDGYYVTQPLQLVQYDETLPVAAVQLTYQSQPYIPPTGAELNVRMGKPDGTSVYNPCLGVDSSGVVYFAFTLQMTIAAGTGTLTVEVTDDGVKNSAPIIVEIRPNPVPEGAIESADEFLTLQEILAEAEKWGQIVQTNASNIQQVVDNLTDIQNAAENAQAAAASAAAAQKAAQEALGFRKFYSAVVPDANGNLDPSRPMVVGPAASVEIESAGDRIQSVTALGFTQQAGTGDPSPSNVRQLTNGGLKLVKKVFVGTESWSLRSSSANSFVASISPLSKSGYSTIYKPFSGSTEIGQSDGVYLVNTSSVIVTDKSCNTVSDFTNKLKSLAESGNPFIIWYQPADESQATGLYAPIVLQGGDYRATCLPLTAPLCEGDSVVSWVKSGCDKVVTFDGSEDESWVLAFQNNGFYIKVDDVTVLPGTTTLSGFVKSTYLTEITSTQIYHGTAYGISLYNANPRICVRIQGVSTVSALKEYLAAHPLTVWYRSTNYTEDADIPVSLETHVQVALEMDGTEGITLYWNGHKDEQLENKRVTFSWPMPYPFKTADVSGSKVSHFKNRSDVTSGRATEVGYYFAATRNVYICLDLSTINAEGETDDTVLRNKIQAYLAAQHAAGTPVTIVYQLATPITYAHPAVVLEAATGDQLTYTVTGQSGGTVSVALKPFQDGGHAKTADSATTAQNATEFDGHAWSEVPRQAPVQSVNSKTGAVTLTAADVGAVPLNHTAVLADGIALKDGSPVNTPADIDHYTVLRIYSNYGAAVCSVPIKGGQTGFLPFINGTSAPNINIVVVNISRTETQLTLETNAALRLATTGITAPGTALSVYRIEGLV